MPAQSDTKHVEVCDDKECSDLDVNLDRFGDVVLDKVLNEKKKKGSVSVSFLCQIFNR